ncbi:hypothetical protein [Mangrovicoccus sp. HB161399]|uniref:hypothetical protein n=1 Tax=Mangrovicoccus sp. HB161399 TaxID=2720392 RepID=UPI001556ECA4|nr:hypothetical protein [Mangrovicoccus sp. HB161399]
MWKRRQNLEDMVSVDAFDDEYHDDVIDLRPIRRELVCLPDDEIHDGTSDLFPSLLERMLSMLPLQSVWRIMRGG